MGGTSHDVKRLKKSGMSTFYTLGFLDHLHLCCFGENSHVFKHIEARYIMSCDTKAQLSDFKLGQKLFQFMRYEIFKMVIQKFKKVRI